MNNERNAFRAGLFIIASIAAIVAIIVGIKGYERILEPDQVRVVEFLLADDVGGLRVGDDVRIGGVKQGVVRDIEVSGHDTPQPDDDRVIVTFSLPSRFALREEASVRVQGTITGTSWLNIDHLGAGEPIPQGVALVGRPGAMAQLFDAAGELAPELVATVRDVRGVTLPRVNDAVATFRTTGEKASGLIDTVGAEVPETADRVRNLADRGSEVMVTARGLLDDTGDDVRGTAANLNAASGTVRERLPELADQVEALVASVDAAVERATGALADVQETFAHAKDVTANARGIVAGNRGRIENMIASLKGTSDNLEAASAEIRRSPWRLLYQPKPGEVENLALYDSTRQFARGAGALSDAAVALRDALEDPTADEQRLERLVEELDETFGSFKQVEERLWTQVRE